MNEAGAGLIITCGGGASVKFLMLVVLILTFAGAKFTVLTVNIQNFVTIHTN